MHFGQRVEQQRWAQHVETQLVQILQALGGYPTHASSEVAASDQQNHWKQGLKDGGHVSNRSVYSGLNMAKYLFFSTIVPKSFWRIFYTHPPYIQW